ncbi:MAG: hypothetical protein JWP38_3694 [Herbaspirillum sp.]|nr:hypothetical protein [Herbaspirillum sp.]
MSLTLIRLYLLHRRSPMSRRAALLLVMERIGRDRQFSIKKITKTH